MVVPVGPIWPGRGKAPLEPQAFYVQTTVVTFAPLLMPGPADYPWTPGPAPIDQFYGWSQTRMFGQDRLPTGIQVYDLAPIWPPYINHLRTWTWSYNLNLIGKDRLPVGAQRYDLTAHRLAPQPIDQTWTWRQVDKIGQDRLPVGVQVYDLVPSQRPPEQIQLHSWQWSYNLNLIGKDQLPVGEQIYDRPTLPIPQIYGWVYAQQIAGAVQQPFTQTDWPLPTSNYRIDQTWTWRQVGMLGQDRLPVGIQIYDRPTLPTPQIYGWVYASQIEEILRPFFQTDWPLPTPNYRIDQTWAWRQVGMLGQDQLPTGVQVYDLAPGQKVPEQIQLHSWQWSYNLNLISKDRMTVGVQYWDRPQLSVPPAQTWIDPFRFWLTAPTLNITITQYYDRPQLPVPPAQTWTWQYNLNLISQDKLPVGQQSTDLAPRDHLRLLQTWIQNTNLALYVTPAVLVPPLFMRNQDWTPPRGAEPDWRRDWAWRQVDKIGQDQLPIRQSDWPLPIAAQPAVQTWIDQTKILLTAAQRPVVQSDWPLPSQPAPTVQTWINTIGLALTAKPFNQQDWPVPKAAPQPAQSWTSSYNLNLIGQDRLPNRQQDWPLSAGHFQPPLQIMVAGKWFNLVPPQPLPPGKAYYDRPTLRAESAADLTNPAWRWPQITPPPVTGVIPLRTLMGTGL